MCVCLIVYILYIFNKYIYYITRFEAGITPTLHRAENRVTVNCANGLVNNIRKYVCRKNIYSLKILLNLLQKENETVSSCISLYQCSTYTYIREISQIE